MSKKSTISSSSEASRASSRQHQQLNVPSGFKFFPKPKLVMFRFLDVIKSKHNLLVEMLTYARANLQAFLDRYWNKEELKKLVEELYNKSLEDKGTNDQTPEIFGPPETVQAIQDSILLYVNWKCTTERNRIDLGHNNAPLQKLLHWVILEGIIDGTFQVAIPDNFVPTFRHFESRGIPQLIFSSVVHQLYPDTRLLTSTDKGDLSGYFIHYDLPTMTRHKETYVHLAKQLTISPADILLVAFSDTECRKAARAGYRVVKIKQRNQVPPKYANITVVNDISEMRIRI